MDNYILRTENLGFVYDDENDSSSIDFYSPEFKFVLKSHLCSKQLLAQGSDGSMTYLDGAKVSELGHWMLLDNVLYGTDTIYATFNPANDALVVDWEIADPEVLEIVAQSVEDNYIVVKAKKLGTTTIEASINNKARKVSINTTVVDAYATGMKGYDGKAGETGYVYKCAVNGFSGAGSIEFMIGFGTDNKVAGYTVISCTDTKGIGDKVASDSFVKSIVGKDVGASIDTISGSTVSSSAVIGGINAAVAHYEANLK